MDDHIIDSYEESNLTIIIQLVRFHYDPVIDKMTDSSIFQGLKSISAQRSWADASATRLCYLWGSGNPVPKGVSGRAASQRELVAGCLVRPISNEYAGGFVYLLNGVYIYI